MAFRTPPLSAMVPGTTRSARAAMPSFIYKILTVADDAAFAAAADAGYAGSADDRRDGFIHLSTREQLAGTLAAHYASAGEVVLLRVAVAALPAAALRWEPARGGALFPHLYDVLPGHAVVRRDRLRRGADGLFILPGDI